MTVSDTAAYILGSALVRLILLKMSTFYLQGQSQGASTDERKKKTLAENRAHGTYLAFSALPVHGNCVQSICSFRVSVLSPAKTFTNILVT